MRVLIVDPSKDLAEVVSTALNRKGFKSYMAHSAQTGISTADRNKPDAVILELLISNHNGLEFIYEFKSYPDWFDVPIVIYSNISPEELNKAPGWEEDMGVVRHFYKPTTSLEDITNFIAGLKK